MKSLNRDEFLNIIEDFRNGEKRTLSLEKSLLEDMDLSNMDLSGIDFSWSDFKNINFGGSNFEKSILDNTKSVNVSYKGANFKDASLFGGDFRGCDLSDTECDGTIFTESILIDANINNLRDSDRTVHFRNFCPQEGYFFGYKKCFDERIVKLLIPKDAKRCSSTSNACRCDKARVVSITDFDGNGFYTEAMSYVDQNFIYKLGEMVYADYYNENRWLDSSHGIHFWMSLDEAKGYM